MSPRSLDRVLESWSESRPGVYSILELNNLWDRDRDT
jgi:hypothetical protein